ncbi:hypothetical protein [Acrocarpospora pleiomorpha]|uniref:hypothetical protein n=1 Tax=Acrocarpospora pleiomorpha TaxID=90975 RepID=UPI0012D3395D|nr:hypothetical protein [Acrocarpospora pleiomorpha]
MSRLSGLGPWPPLVATASAVLGVAQLVHTQVVPFASAGDYLIEAAYSLYLASAIPGVLTIRRANPKWGLPGNIGTVLYALAHGLIAIPVSMTLLLTNQPPPQLSMLFLPGLALWLAGSALMGIAMFRQNQPILGIALPAALPLAMLLGAAGPLVEAALWATLSTTGTRRQQPPHASPRQHPSPGRRRRAAT